MTRSGREEAQRVERDPELTERALVRHLIEACEAQLEALRGTLSAHESLFGSLDAGLEQESDTLLRLRKVYCHAIAVTSWSVDEWAIHAMAPDIRAAVVQLRTLVRDGVCAEMHEPGDTDCPRPRCFSSWDGLLAPFSHPTTVVLMFYSSAGGLRRDDVRSLSRLCLLLFGLSDCYASVLALEALRLGRPLEEGRLGTASRPSPAELLESAQRYLASE